MVFAAATPFISWIALGVALLAAIVAPTVSYLLQKGALTAEMERLEKQLAHDRLMRDTEDTRTRIDEAIDVGETAFSLLFDASSLYRFADGSESTASETLDVASDKLAEYSLRGRRIMIRVGRSDSLVKAMEMHRRAMGEGCLSLSSAISEKQDFADEDWDAIQGKIASAHATVIDLAVDYVGARLRED